ncbi:secreted RxLR effector peptide protein, putative [Phytophthora infestans T30-4]|uniref:Secreted RxLR effector peptide protein, putative n=1 Tax=Phytophthora infestans (strain T30-4) TaxID=403677 RepID=D0MXG1_PHYIT|nr:secreted RxLR effector peptide protein, putative [Phytophthora infestans T30-4]EEY64324.1 secreted RxLR effector peptide protein, putative [Phytophthora infestans T30-4]|eukprot:XP_002907760.1 secreted RxLR effector peptide protein, putative [Phytophthora infestans T30-4]
MRVFCLVLLVAAVLQLHLPKPLHSKTLIRSQEGQIENDSHRSLRVDPAKEVAEEEERFKVPIVDKITKYLIQKMLDYCLYRNKDPKQVWGILRLNGYKGRAHLKPRHKYYRTYLAMWKDKKAKEAAKNAANFA